MAKKLNLIFIHVEAVATFKNMYCEINPEGTLWAKYLNPRLNTYTTITTAPTGEKDIIIPYGSIVHIKDALLHWTHGKVYVDTDGLEVSSDSNAILADGTTYELKKDDNGNLYISKETPISIIGSIDDGTIEGDGSSILFSDYTSSHTVTITPSNSISYTVNPGTHKVTITKVVFSKSSTFVLSSSTEIPVNEVISGTAADKTASVGTAGNGYVAKSTKTAAINKDNTSITATAPATLYARIYYKLDDGDELYIELDPKSYEDATYSISFKYPIVYRTTSSGSWMTISSPTSQPKNFSVTIKKGDLFYFAYPKSWNEINDVSYGPNNETSMFDLDSDTLHKGATYRVYKRLAPADAASTTYTITFKS